MKSKAVKKIDNERIMKAFAKRYLIVSPPWVLFILLHKIKLLGLIQSLFVLPTMTQLLLPEISLQCFPLNSDVTVSFLEILSIADGLVIKTETVYRLTST